LKQIKHVQFVSFDIVANGIIVEATFDFVERIVQLVAFDNLASTLLLCGRGLTCESVSDRIENKVRQHTDAILC